MISSDLINRIVQEGGTPAYVFDLDALKGRIETVRKCLGEYLSADILFAIKANPFLVKAAREWVDGFEVCSPGEMHICEKEAVDPDQIVLSGVNKQVEDIEQALRYGVTNFTSESVSQFDKLQKSAAAYEKTIRVLLRLSSGNQFGMSEEEIISAVRRKAEAPNLEIVGIQYFSGTMKKGNKVKDEFTALLDFCRRLETETGYNPDRIEYGPGWIVDYFGNNDEQEMLNACAQAFAAASGSYHISLEIGRFLAAECGTYLTKVVDVKKRADQAFCIVDGGINHVNYYGNMMGSRIPPMKHFRLTDGAYGEVAKTGETFDLCICGSLCTTADLIVRKFPVSSVEFDDVFVFDKIGAYSVTEGIYLFLSRTMPRVYFYKNEILSLARDFQETYRLNCIN